MATASRDERGHRNLTGTFAEETSAARIRACLTPCADTSPNRTARTFPRSTPSAPGRRRCWPDRA
ncbi:hypothetical protein EBESD8_34170 [Rhodococcus aetherivorans]|nr:hypothetical protein EBESD8_34170 [Rhodococcus aetherivorans]